MKRVVDIGSLEGELEAVADPSPHTLPEPHAAQQARVINPWFVATLVVGGAAAFAVYQWHRAEQRARECACEASS